MAAKESIALTHKASSALRCSNANELSAAALQSGFQTSLQYGHCSPTRRPINCTNESVYLAIAYRVCSEIDINDVNYFYSSNSPLREKFSQIVNILFALIAETFI
ncbi:MAG: hypothetical protein P4L10_01355 [Acidobacteriaceae bacterium]|nr:hypothetical protein [Acidobacteriaceae bacterium]